MNALAPREYELIQGDAATVLQRLPEKSVHMVYSDPPFGNEQIWTGAAGSFSDKWRPSSASCGGWVRLGAARPDCFELVKLACQTERQRAYIGIMAGIILGVHRVLRPTGTFWLHFDDTMGAHLRLLCDAIFGPSLALGTLVWRRMRGGHRRERGFERVHDTIACYGRTPAARWRLWRIGTLGGDPLTADWFPRFDAFAAGAPLGSSDGERVKYPTQKPVALLEEIILSATLPGDVVLDPTCGSGTTLFAAARNSRRSIGIDLSADAISCAFDRLTPRDTAQADFFSPIL